MGRAVFLGLCDRSKGSSREIIRCCLKDEADNHLIELAVAGNAQIIATHKIKDFQNAELLFPNLSILKSEEIIRS